MTARSDFPTATVRQNDRRAGASSIAAPRTSAAMPPNAVKLCRSHRMNRTACSFAKDAGHSIVRTARALQAFEGSTRQRVAIGACVAHQGYLGLARARG